MEIKITGTPDEIAKAIGLLADNVQPITVTYTTESTGVSLETSPAYTAEQIQRAAQLTNDALKG